MESEQFLNSALHTLLPEAAFITEETGSWGNDDFHWVIDPLDGTTNFASGIPYFAVSIALTYQAQPLFGMIFDPLHNELFYGWEKGGAWIKTAAMTQKLQISSETELSKSLLLLGIPYAKDGNFFELLKKMNIILPLAFDFRHMGAASLDAVYVATGRADALFCSNLKWWDIAAGILILKEAGGKVTTFEGNEITPSYRSLIGGNLAIYDKLYTLLNSHI